MSLAHLVNRVPLPHPSGEPPASSSVRHVCCTLSPPQLQLAFAPLKIYIGYTEVLYLNKVKSVVAKRFGGIKLPTPGPETHSTLFSIILFSHLTRLKRVSEYWGSNFVVTLPPRTAVSPTSPPFPQWRGRTSL